MKIKKKLDLKIYMMQLELVKFMEIFKDELLSERVVVNPDNYLE